MNWQLTVHFGLLPAILIREERTIRRGRWGDDGTRGGAGEGGREERGLSLTQHSSIHRDLLFSHLKISTHQSDSVNAGSTEVAVTEAHKQRIGDGFINYWLLMLKGAHRKREGHRSFLVQTMAREIKNGKGWRCMHKELQGRWGKSVWRGMTLRSGKRLFRNSSLSALPSLSVFKLGDDSYTPFSPKSHF